MNGHVDGQLRALISIPVAPSEGGEQQKVLAWVDTAFNGSLVIPKRLIEQLRLVKESATEAVLADGKTVELETYGCFVEWFGTVYETQVIANDNEYPLVGTMMLAGHRLEIDYAESTVTLR